MAPREPQPLIFRPPPDVLLTDGAGLGVKPPVGTPRSHMRAPEFKSSLLVPAPWEAPNDGLSPPFSMSCRRPGVSAGRLFAFVLDGGRTARRTRYCRARAARAMCQQERGCWYPESYSYRPVLPPSRQGPNSWAPSFAILCFCPLQSEMRTDSSG